VPQVRQPFATRQMIDNMLAGLRLIRCLRPGALDRLNYALTAVWIFYKTRSMACPRFT